MKLFKRKAEPVFEPVFEPVRELSGIERVALEAEYKRQGDIADRDRERREKLQARILEIEKKIGPQLAELNQLKAQLNPFDQYRNIAAIGYDYGRPLSDSTWSISGLPGMFGGIIGRGGYFG